MKRLIAIAAVAALPAAALNAAVTSATPFADNMVLQRGRPVPVWGKADPGEKVTVSFAGQTKTVNAGADGSWRVTLDAMEASRENRTMTIGDTQIKNVLVGEVWFASGQSNMECPIWGKAPRYRDAKGGIMTQMTRRPLVRYVKNDHNLSCKPRLDWKAKWRDFSPQSFKDKTLSAVAFYYALEIYSALEIPVGIIDSSWGGTRIEPWTPLAPGEKEAPPPSDGNIARSRPHSMFNGMVAGFAPYAIRGFIWYQGCANASDGERYVAKMHRLYDGWAREFENPELKLYFVQLAPFRKDYFRIRLAQAQFAAEEKNAALAVICDAGNLDDIHPNEKEIVAKRLAIHALKRDYGFSDIVDDSPVLKDWRVEDGKFVLSFKDAATWYVYRNDNKMDIPGFEIAGPDGKFVPAKVLNKIADGRGTLQGSELVVAAQGVTSPRQLRYLATSPWTGALYSFDSGLPLGTFEIDARSVVTERKPGVTASAGDALLEGFRKVIVADIPVGKPLKADGYSFDASADAGSFTRIAYKFELEERDGNVDWVVAAMDAFTDDAAKAGVPSMSGAFIQRKVGGLSVRSNVAGVEDCDGVEGAVEFFNVNYSTRKGMADVPGDDKCYDINDIANKAMDPGYGSMQVHNLASGKTVFALNCFNGPNPDVGIGSNAGGQHPDWTFEKNAALYKSRRLAVYVK